VDVDAELAQIIEAMRNDATMDKAIRNYARAFKGDDKDWSEKYKERY